MNLKKIRKKKKKKKTCKLGDDGSLNIGQCTSEFYAKGFKQKKKRKKYRTKRTKNIKLHRTEPNHTEPNTK